jgi:hypothetical protein
VGGLPWHNPADVRGVKLEGRKNKKIKQKKQFFIFIFIFFPPVGCRRPRGAPRRRLLKKKKKIFFVFFFCHLLAAG